MAERLRVVVGLLERAQDEERQRVAAVAGALDVLADEARAGGDDVRGLRRRHVLVHGRRRDAERRELLDEAQRALAVGLLVDAVQRRHPALGEHPRDLLVSRDHEVLDQPVRLGLLAGPRLRDVPAGVEAKLRLGGLEFERRLRQPALVQRGGDGASCGEGRRPGLERRLVAREDSVDALVVQALVGADRRAIERRPLDRGPGEVELDGDRRAPRPGNERAGVVGQRLGQHRLDAAGDVDARPAARGLAIDERARRDVRADVGDVHPYARHAAVERLGGDRVVEVTGGDGVDRERRQAGEVAAHNGGVQSRIAGLARRALDGGIEVPAQAAVEHERLEDVTGHIRLAEDAHDLRVAAAARRRAHEHEVSDAGLRVALDDHPPAALEERLGGEEAPALVEHGDDPVASARDLARGGGPAGRGLGASPGGAAARVRGAARRSGGPPAGR